MRSLLRRDVYVSIRFFLTQRVCDQNWQIIQRAFDPSRRGARRPPGDHDIGKAWPGERI